MSTRRFLANHGYPLPARDRDEISHESKALREHSTNIRTGMIADGRNNRWNGTFVSSSIFAPLGGASVSQILINRSL